MIDSREIESGTNIDSDVCIIGTGAAGISIARELSGKNIKVSLLEAGGLKFEKNIQDLYSGENVGLDYNVEMSRRRFFGGTTNSWSGFCRPLEEINFYDRPWIPLASWPFKRDELISYYKRAQKVLKLGDFVYSGDYWEKKFKNPAFQRIPFESDRVVSEVYQLYRVRFGKDYRKDIEDASNINTYLYANVVDIEADENSKKVTRVRVVTAEGKKIWFSAKIFILATGGIENARLLLLSNKGGKNTGLGNQNDLVGRYFMEHPHFYLSGKIAAPKDNTFINACKGYFSKFKYEGINPAFLLLLTISDKVQIKEKLMCYSAVLSPPAEAEGFQTDVTNIFTEFSNAKPKQPLVLDIITRGEQSPNPQSRVTLSEKRDVFGLNKVKLDWRVNSADIDSIKKSMQIIAEELGFADLARMKILTKDKISDIAGGKHHMGTTRMNSNPKKGVVDKNCKVHGISNLFVAGSSVFPTVGAANPTLTIVALSLKLAEHVKTIMGV